MICNFFVFPLLNSSISLYLGSSSFFCKKLYPANKNLLSNSKISSKNRYTKVFLYSNYFTTRRIDRIELIMNGRIQRILFFRYQILVEQVCIHTINPKVQIILLLFILILYHPPFFLLYLLYSFFVEEQQVYPSESIEVVIIHTNFSMMN